MSSSVQNDQCAASRSGPSQPLSRRYSAGVLPLPLSAAVWRTSAALWARWMVRRSRCLRASFEQLVEHPGRAVLRGVCGYLALHAPSIRAVEALHQSLGALKKLFAPLAGVLVAPVANLQRERVRAALAQEQTQARVHHVLGVAVHEAQGVYQRRRAAAYRLQAAQGGHRSALVVGHGEGDGRHVGVDRVDVHVLHRAADHRQNGVGVGIDQPRQRRLAARVHPLQFVVRALEIRCLAHGGEPAVHHGQRAAVDDCAVGVAGDHRGVGYEHVHGPASVYASGAALRTRQSRSRECCSAKSGNVLEGAASLVCREPRSPCWN